MWKDVVKYTDTDHDWDWFSDPQLGPIHVEGDSKRLDYPEVIFTNIRHSVTVLLENE